MPNLSPKLKLKYNDYIEACDKVAENLDFLLDNLGYKVNLDCSVKSIENLETVYWKILGEGMPSDLCDDQAFAQMIGQYLGQCLISITGAVWIQCKDANPMFGQPCIDGFGNKPWERIFPIEIALNIKNLPKVKPDFPGVKNRRVFAAAYEKAIEIYNHAMCNFRGQ